MYNCSKSSQLFFICCNLRYVFLSFEFIKDIKDKDKKCFRMLPTEHLPCI